jgi:hypothetical protein
MAQLEKLAIKNGPAYFVFLSVTKKESFIRVTDQVENQY